MSPGAVQAEIIGPNKVESGIAGLAYIEPFEFTELLFIFEFDQILELPANKF